MTLQEIFQRIIRAHLLVIIVCAVLPVLAVVALEQRQPEKWTGSVRIQVVSTAPSSTTEADGVSSRVLALATSPTLVEKAMRDAGLTGDPSYIAQHEVTAARLGESPVVDVSVTDTSPANARTLASSLVRQVVAFMNNGSRPGLDDNVRDLDSQIADATAHRTILTDRLSSAGSPQERQTLVVKIGIVQDEINSLTAQRAALLQNKLEADQAVVIDGDSPEVRPVPSALVPQAALALVLGLIVGVAIAALLETLSPRLAGIRAVARALGAPVLGRSSDDPTRTAQAVGRAARRQGVETVVLMGVDRDDDAVTARVLGSLRLRATEVEEDEAEDAEATPLQKVPVKLPGKPSPKGTARSTGSNRSQPSPRANERPGVSDPFSIVAVKFSSLDGLSPEAERTAGVVVVSDGNCRVRDLDSLQDRLTSLRWPVVGIVHAHHERSLRP